MLSKVQMKDDLMYMLDELDKIHISLYFSCPKDEILKYIDDLINSNYDFRYIVKMVIKRLNGEFDQHTTLVDDGKNTLPFKYRILNDGVYVVDTTEEYHDLKFSKVLSISGVPIERIIEEFDNVISYSVIGWRNFKIENALISDYMILPSLMGKVLEFEFQTTKGRITLPIYDKNYETISSSENLKTIIIDGALLITYNKCNKKDKDFEELISKVDNIIHSNDINRIIVDLRNNDGGNNGPFLLFKDYLLKLGVKTFTLVNGGTFSSGVFNAIDMKEIGSILIGENIGEGFNNFGNYTRECITLPNSGLKVHGTYKYFYLDEDKEPHMITSQEDFINLDSKYKCQEFVPINYEVVPNIDDIRQGIDTQLMYALRFPIDAKSKILK